MRNVTLASPTFLRAVQDADTTRVQHLLQNRADPNAQDKDGDSVLLLAVWYGHLATARALIDAGADVNTQGLGEQTSPLHLAARRDQLDFGKLLLSRGADTTSRNDVGETALDIARRDNNLPFVALLEEHALRTEIQSSPSVLQRLRNAVRLRA